MRENRVMDGPRNLGYLYILYNILLYFYIVVELYFTPTPFKYLNFYFLVNIT